MSTNDGCRADKRKARAEKDAPTVEAVALRVLGEHELNPWRSTVGKGWTRKCSCGEELPDSDARAHVAAHLAAAIEARP